MTDRAVVAAFISGVGFALAVTSAAIKFQQNRIEQLENHVSIVARKNRTLVRIMSNAIDLMTEEQAKQLNHNMQFDMAFETIADNY